jgi:hypothetical protein
MNFKNRFGIIAVFTKWDLSRNIFPHFLAAFKSVFFSFFLSFFLFFFLSFFLSFFLVFWFLFLLLKFCSFPYVSTLTLIISFPLIILYFGWLLQILHVDWEHFIYLFYLFIFFSTGAWTQYLHLEPLYQPYFCDRFFEIGSHKLLAQAGFELQSSWSLYPE